MNSLRRRLLLSHIIPVLLLIPVLGIALIYVLETRVVLVNLATQLVRQADLLAETALDYPAIWQDTAEAQAFVDRFHRRMTAQLRLVSADGRLLASSNDADALHIGQPLPDAIPQEIQNGVTSAFTDYSLDLSHEVADIWSPVFDEDGEYLGAVRVTHQLATVRERFQRLRTLTVQVLLAGLVVGGLTGLLLGQTLDRPIERLTSAVQRMSSGEALQPVAEQGPTELQMLAAAFNGLVERLNIMRVGRRQLLSNLVHEVARPLGALRAANQALLDGAEEEPELRHQLLMGVDSELTTLQRVVDDLVRYYDRELGPLDLELQPTSLSPWLNTILSHWGEAARARDLHWETRIPAGLPTIAIDSDRLGQAIGNLVSNAIKFTPPGGTVSVEASDASGIVRIAVRDTGIGVAPEEQERIFEPFFRSHQKARFPRGMGLGLTMARELVLAHGGQLEIESRQHEGSRFTISLPV